MDSETSLQSTLHVFADEPYLVAFESGPLNATCAFVFVRGPAVGFRTLNELRRELQATIADFGWSLVEPILSSSFDHWGPHSIETDAVEIGRLCQYLEGQGKDRIVLLGHGAGTSPAQQALS
jgi:hypothetical protein